MMKCEKTPTGVEVLTLADVKEFLRIDGSFDDDVLEALITQSRDILEKYLDRSMIESDIKLYLSPRQELVLPFGSVDMTVATVCRVLETNDVLEHTYDYLTLTITDVVSKTFWVSYSTLADVPDGLKLAWMEVIAYLYENRGDVLNIPLFLITNYNLSPFKNKMWI